MSIEDGTWASYSLRVRSKAGLGPTAFGKRVGVSRQQVHRWEEGKSVPTQYDTIAAVAALGGDDVSVALRAAGQEKARELTVSNDPEIAAIQDADAPSWLKATLIQHVTNQREADRQRREEYVKGILRQAGRLPSSSN